MSHTQTITYSNTYEHKKFKIINQKFKYVSFIVIKFVINCDGAQRITNNEYNYKLQDYEKKNGILIKDLKKKTKFRKKNLINFCTRNTTFKRPIVPFELFSSYLMVHGRGGT